jgi:hypothetical protein
LALFKLSATFEADNGLNSGLGRWIKRLPPQVATLAERHQILVIIVGWVVV